ncbi:type VI secretion system protein ImpG [Pseudoduganella lurida]|uniref:Type VI secretion system protein ImpG n=1 Tax=Pseudoduganella lurida TaxID=1036180 RepID=A0A562QV17_9BURK|nr:type VI secretion system baseplate subunit TssF [Pseudoduganella lurida]TWI60629.1 type VI secretion system protein ImpG [Pseudoduganella lurida]
MDKLLPYYERELALLRRYQQDAAHKYPRLARLLGAADPANERIMQGVALLCARTAYKLDHALEPVTAGLLSAQEPYYLRALPSCSIVQLDRPTGSHVTTIPRGTELKTTMAPVCRFRTAYDVISAPVVVTSAAFVNRVDVPASLRLPDGLGGRLTMTIASSDASFDLAAAAVPLRLYIDADGPVRTAVFDTLFTRTLCTVVESGGKWRKLAGLPIKPIGFGSDEALLPVHRRQNAPLRMLTEYFLLSEKFAFFDVDLKPLLDRADTRELTLHFLLPDLSQAPASRHLRTLSGEMLRTRCTPVINLFARKAMPIRLKPRRTTYPLTVAHGGEAPAIVYGVKAVQLRHRETPTVALGGLHAAHHARGDFHWIERHANPTLGMAEEISFVDRDEQPFHVNGGTADIDVTCTNGDLPARLPPCGLSAGDVAAGCPIRMLRPPTRPGILADERDGHLKIIQALVPRYMQMARFEELPALLDLLRLHALPDDPVTERQLSGILGLTSRDIVGWMRLEHSSMLANGVTVNVTIDETAFVERSIFVLALILDQLLACSTAANNFTQITVLASDGEVRLQLPRRKGTSSPV